MSTTAKNLRRGLYGMIAGGLLGGVATATIALPSASAAPDECTASGVATAQSSVQLSMSTYLQMHPQTNQAMTDIAKQSPTEAQVSYRTYFENNPKVADDLKGIQQPVTELSSQCGIQVTPNQLTDALKTAV
ncbi:hemophore-related protein [Mycolicibacterium sp. P9-64]|uniref:hemophore-related protein n=1 Tax=Mycolicibacterium sp. P9-64 TaxID=2024612 RepID=UPI0011EEC49D|nr:hemophore-related protein [Mycolicibacterium sp. P9-64]KAA0085863.1 hemophore-related protein [Mycolicibacterium sp. P9-64]